MTNGNNNCENIEGGRIIIIVKISEVRGSEVGFGDDSINREG